MYSVTQIASKVSQPYGGYLKPSSFSKISLDDENVLSDSENINPSLVGTAVDYMTRFMIGTEKEKAFRISLLGSQKVNQEKKAQKLLKSINGLDDTSIINACKLVGYDVCFRAGAAKFKPIEEINPDDTTINNVRIMINRGISFFNEYGPVTDEGMTFEGGYTRVVSSGDADFMTEDTLWDFKVSKSRLRTTQTLQILIYYILGIHSDNSSFQNIKKLGFFNPRQNIILIKDISEIPPETIEEIEQNVIGYNDNEERVISILREKYINKAQDAKKSMSNNNNTVNKENVEEKTLTITDVMKHMQCSRYMVMKYYTDEGLPLVKNGSRYLISEAAFVEWVKKHNERIEAEERRKVIITAIAILGVIVFVALLIMMD